MRRVNFTVMGRLVLPLIMGGIIMGCATTKIAHVEEEWGPPAKVEKLNGNSVIIGISIKVEPLRAGAKWY
jgi:uncharacterized protein YkvS